jgi:DnaJ-class molecular chaperone
MTTRYCHVCAGAGSVKVVELIRCPECSATGKIDSNTCPACNGKGQQYIQLRRVCRQCKGSGLRIPDPPAD